MSKSLCLSSFAFFSIFFIAFAFESLRLILLFDSTASNASFLFGSICDMAMSVIRIFSSSNSFACCGLFSNTALFINISLMSAPVDVFGDLPSFIFSMSSNDILSYSRILLFSSEPNAFAILLSPLNSTSPNCLLIRFSSCTGTSLSVMTMFVAPVIPLFDVVWIESVAS